MSQRISRREFLKLLGAGAVTTAALTGCGSATQRVNREPYASMPEYTLPGTSTYYATTCRECPAGCGLVVRTVEGRAIKVEGNPAHPVSRGRTCARGQASVQTLYNPDRLQSAVKQAQRGSGKFDPMSWEEAIQVVQDALANNDPDSVAFLLGLENDHLADLVNEITAAMGARAPYRFGALGMLDARNTLVMANVLLFGHPGLPVFDIAHAEVTFSFGANFTETWLSPVFYAGAYGAMRKGTPGQRGYLVHFEPRMSQTAANADEWYPIKPGTEALVAQALGALVAEEIGIPTEGLFADVDVAAAASESGVSEEDLHRLAMMFAQSQRRVAIPGASALGHTNGLDAAKAIMGLNVLVENLGKAGGVSLMPESALGGVQMPSTLNDLNALVKKMNSGKIKALFIHGCNPVFELPAASGFAAALQNVPLVVAFSSFPDETAQQADFVLPDHTGLEAWGYQKVSTASDRITLSSLQPVVVPVQDTRATADVLLAAVQAIGGDLAKQVPYENEVAFIKARLEALVGEDGYYAAPEINTLWARWLQVGGWWDKDALLTAPDLAHALNTLQKQPATLPAASFSGDEAEYPLHLMVYPAANLGDGRGANNPWLQETPDPMTTVMWNSWIEISPDLALELGVRDDDVVRVTSPAGSVEAVVYVYPAIRPDTVAIPVGQGHTALGRYAQNRGCNPLQLLDIQKDASGNLAFAATRVKIEPTGKKHQLARMEDRVGVYGDRYGELYR
ncbi:MAG: hypothetical protein D6755_02435 [Anaerolineae bacterium]|nr:MAG: hypothetical protein D6755_02435 [Anaerolineae bacterium]